MGEEEKDVKGTRPATRRARMVRACGTQNQWVGVSKSSVVAFQALLPVPGRLVLVQGKVPSWALQEGSRKEVNATSTGTQCLGGSGRMAAEQEAGWDTAEHSKTRGSTLGRMPAASQQGAPERGLIHASRGIRLMWKYLGQSGTGGGERDADIQNDQHTTPYTHTCR